MRPRASQVAKTRLVETEEDVETVHEDVETVHEDVETVHEDVETYRPVLDAIKATIRDRQAELARLEGEPAIVGGKTPLALSGGRWRGQGVGSVSTSPKLSRSYSDTCI